MNGPLAPRSSGRRHEFVAHPGAGALAVRALRKGRWKLILGDGSGGFSSPRGTILKPGEDGPMQLYLLSEDPRERRNLVKTRPDKKEELLAELNRVRKAGRSRY